MLASMSPGEIFMWVVLSLATIIGGITVIYKWTEIGEYFFGRRMERARTFGYRHRSARSEFDAMKFTTEAERAAYRLGWEERAQAEDDLGADENGMISPDAKPVRKARGR